MQNPTDSPALPALDHVLGSDEALAAGEGRVGGKAFGLARMAAVDLPNTEIPPWFVVAAEASVAHLWRADAAESVLATLQSLPGAAQNELRAASEQLVGLVTQARLAAPLIGAVGQALEALGDGPYAVRSSMVGEDSAERSFAGQLETYLYRRNAAEVLDAIRLCWASAYSPHALAYQLRGVDPDADADAIANVNRSRARQAKTQQRSGTPPLPFRGRGSGGGGRTLELPRVAVVVQRMVTGEVSGVAFSAHPATGRRDHVLVSAAWGLGEGVVSGACDADDYVWDVKSGAEVEVRCADKARRVVADPSGVGTVEQDVPEPERARRCVQEPDVARIATAATAMAQAFGAPQDVEWTLAGARLVLLQSRPITALPSPANTDGPRTVFNNSNIQESYCGVTTPLTFSFAQSAYESVYEQTMRALGLPQSVVEAHRFVLRNLLGLVRGRVYYNINNWYRGLLLLPSFGRNKADMEAMMGLDVPVDFVEDQVLSLPQKVRKLPRMLMTLVRLLARFRGLPRAVPRFLSEFEAAYRRVNRAGFETASFSQLMAVVDQLRREMVENWATPILNDVYVLMAMGKLRRLVESTGVENPQELVNNLMSGEEGIESLEPTRMLMRLASIANEDAGLAAALRLEPPSAAMAELKRCHLPFTARLEDYIERYGDRVMGELKLETVTAREDPSFVVRVLRNYLARPDLEPDKLAKHERELRTLAESTLLAKLGGVAKLRGPGILRRARESVKNRENMRLARTRMFGLFRDVYRAIGDRLVEAGKLRAPRDVFYLSTAELLAYHEGRSVSADLAGIAAARAAEFAAYQQQDVPHHFETLGPVYHGNLYRGPESDVAVDRDTAVLRGTGCYPGRVEAPLRVVMSPEDDLDMAGHILTTLRTDPGWAPLFPAASGILVERGSTLSHSAVVARELGIPAIVGVPGLLSVVRNGERVILDGGEGTVERLGDPISRES